MRGSEGALVRRIRMMLLARGAYVEKNHGHSHESAGRPDLTGCLDGRFYGIEVKVPKEKPTDIQWYVIGLIHAAGGIAFYTDNTDRVLQFLTDFPNVCKHGLGACAECPYP